jgi:phage-related protein
MGIGGCGVEQGHKRIPAVFYRSNSGSEPVRDWLRSLPVEVRRILGYNIGLVEFGWPIGMPLCRSLGAGLGEVRSSLTNGRTARVIFCIAEERMVLLHGFIKKSQRTPVQDLALARSRQKEIAS